MKLNLEILADDSVISANSDETINKIKSVAERFLKTNKLSKCKVLGCQETSHPNHSIFDITFEGPLTELLCIYGKYFYGKKPDELDLDDLRDLVGKETGMLTEGRGKWYVDWTDSDGETGTSGPFDDVKDAYDMIKAAESRRSSGENTEFGEPYQKDPKNVDVEVVKTPPVKAKPMKIVKPIELKIKECVVCLFRECFPSMQDISMMSKAEVGKMAETDDHARLFLRDIKNCKYTDCIVMSCPCDSLDQDKFEDKMELILSYIAVSNEPYYVKSDVDGGGLDWIFFPVIYSAK